MENPPFWPTDQQFHVTAQNKTKDLELRAVSVGHDRFKCLISLSRLDVPLEMLRSVLFDCTNKELGAILALMVTEGEQGPYETLLYTIRHSVIASLPQHLRPF